MPKRDLNDFLSYLDSNTVEPLKKVSFKRQTQKALILMFLATGRRCSNLLAMSKSKHRNEDNSRLSIEWLEDYRPKNMKERFSPELPSIEKLVINNKRPTHCVQLELSIIILKQLLP